LTSFDLEQPTSYDFGITLRKRKGMPFTADILWLHNDTVMSLM